MQILPHQYSISEVAEITGINSVTLRAWERRYGLLKPQRTDRGHRYYLRSDLDRIERIQTWLKSGVSVGKVKLLIDLPQGDVPVVNAAWQESVDELLSILQQFQTRQLQFRLKTWCKEYPLALLADNVIALVAQRLRNTDANIAALQLKILGQHIYRYAAFEQQKTAAKQKRVGMLVVLLGEADTWVEAGMLSLISLRVGLSVEVVNNIDVDSIALLSQLFQPQCIIVVGQHSLSHGERQLLQRTAEFTSASVYTFGALSQMLSLHPINAVERLQSFCEYQEVVAQCHHEQ